MMIITSSTEPTDGHIIISGKMAPRVVLGSMIAVVIRKGNFRWELS